MSLRDRLAAPVVWVYWLALFLGLALYTALRADHVWVVVPLWIGTIGGTVLGQCLALRDYRLWLVACIVGGVTLWGTIFAPAGLEMTSFWMTFAPAALCGALSLADRWSLVAYWFPVAVWMLTVLDGRADHSALAGSRSLLIGGLAVLLVAFLYARESRRVGLWQAVATAPLATTQSAAVRKERPGAHVGRAGWGLAASAIAFAITAWVAPKLWQLESADTRVIVAGSGAGGTGAPCCPVDAPAKRTRVKEYFDLIRGREDREPAPACVVCAGQAPEHDAYARPQLAAPSSGGVVDDVAADPLVVSAPAVASTGDAVAAVASEPVPTSPTPAVELARPPTVRPDEPRAPPALPAAPPAPVRVDAIDPVAPIDPIDPRTSVAQTPSVDPPAVASAPPAIAAVASIPSPPETPVDGSPLVRWLLVLLAGALAYQVVAIGLRPIRRAVTLRHLRRPFWSETVDQRVSNWWQLVLVGLRDAGWRASSGETPCELARRVGITGVERCATILERTRHGVGLDATDLTDMRSSAEAAYGAARQQVGPVARRLAWLRWPLT